MSTAITKRKYNALGKVFAREVEGALPLQSKAAVFRELEEDGLVETYTREFGVDRFGAITVSGWCLTEFGRFIYCINCEQSVADLLGAKA